VLEASLRRIGDRQFLQGWQVIRAATQPDIDTMAWNIGDVACRRYRHSLIAPDHGVTLDVCQLSHPDPRNGWRIMVVNETWWDANRKVVRTHLWASHLGGSRDRAMAWFMAMATAHDRSGP